MKLIHSNESASSKTRSPDMEECIANCLDCYRVCEEAIQYCLRRGGNFSNVEHIGSLRDCASICQVAARFMIQESRFHHQTCAVCADICLTCAEDCSSFEQDGVIRQCEEVCRRCAESCDRMSAMAA